jgi:O-6-methylguanine DNA methyltransferase
MTTSQISYATLVSPLGLVLLGATPRGLCWLGLGDAEGELLAELRSDYRGAPVGPDAATLRDASAAVLAYLAGDGPCAELALDVAGTPFQLRVWAALRAIPYGETRTYGQLAASLGLAPGAARAVGAANGANRVSLVIPCHRLVGSDGGLHGFRWGLRRKAALLALERDNAPGPGAA